MVGDGLLERLFELVAELKLVQKSPIKEFLLILFAAIYRDKKNNRD
jgi:hypothetical protein